MVVSMVKPNKRILLGFHPAHRIHMTFRLIETTNHDAFITHMGMDVLN